MTIDVVVVMVPAGTIHPIKTTAVTVRTDFDEDGVCATLITFDHAAERADMLAETLAAAARGRPISMSGIIVSGPPSLGTLAECIIELSPVEPGLARHHRGRAQAGVPARGFHGCDEQHRARR